MRSILSVSRGKNDESGLTIRAQFVQKLEEYSVDVELIFRWQICGRGSSTRDVPQKIITEI